VRLWFDEDLSPTLVRVANAPGFAATCNRDRSLLGASDARLRERVQAEGFVLVTDNAADFRPMLARETIHPGLIVLPAAHGRCRQQQLAEAVILFVARAAAAAEENTENFMVNRIVEIDDDGHAMATDMSS
jgi:predicted nuclease of predicted toxin-antitoxin system